MIITIDGPAGSGKSTAARNLATALGIAFLDTGATYRAVTLKAINENADMGNDAELAEIARNADIRLDVSSGQLKVILDGGDVTLRIRNDDISSSSYYVARSAACREILVELQRCIGKQLGSFVTEGRDQGTVVFPDAQWKFYLDASPEVRAQRRCAEAQARGEKVDYQQILWNIIERDSRDKNRAVGPLAKAPDAINVDTSVLTIDQTVQTLLKYVRGGK